MTGWTYNKFYWNAGSFQKAIGFFRDSYAVLLPWVPSKQVDGKTILLLEDLFQWESLNVNLFMGDFHINEHRYTPQNLGFTTLPLHSKKKPGCLRSNDFCLSPPFLCNLFVWSGWTRLNHLQFEIPLTTKSGWWLNQPIWNIWVIRQKWFIFPNFRSENNNIFELPSLPEMCLNPLPPHLSNPNHCSDPQTSTWSTGWEVQQSRDRIWSLTNLQDFGGGWTNPIEKDESKMGSSSPNRGEHT